MKRVGFIIKVRADRLEEYRQHHKAVWSEMLAALSDSGWHNYSLFLRDDGLLFGYFETPDSLAAAQAAMENREVNARWQAMMSPFFEIPPGAHPDQMFIELEEIFHLD
ncbi:MAG: L-rhamnose mutarotase [Anaerolineae bacterium]|nr:L-rhamnose mutarotase [Anaerolineae bacterium]